MNKLTTTGSAILILLLSACRSSQPTPVSDPGLLSGSGPGDHMAVLSEIGGEVSMRQHEQAAFIAALEGATLFQNGQVQTGEQGRVRLELSDRSFVRLGPMTIFTLVGFEDTGDGLLTRLRLGPGELWGILKGGALEVETPSGLAVVRGSCMSVSMDGAGHIRVGCLEGSCRVLTALETVELVAGQAAVLPSAEEWQEYTQGSQTETLSPPGILLEMLSERDIAAWLEYNPEATQDLPAVAATAGSSPSPPPLQATPDGPWAVLALQPSTTPEHVTLPYLPCLDSGACPEYCSPLPRPGCALFRALLEAQGVIWPEFLSCMSTSIEAQVCADRSR